VIASAPTLVCFDDAQHLPVLSPFPTVADQPAETLGKRGKQVLLERASGKAGLRNCFMLQADLIIRTSCGKDLGVRRRDRTI
jgi:LacI family transcriptional regulator